MEAQQYQQHELINFFSKILIINDSFILMTLNEQ